MTCPRCYGLNWTKNGSSHSEKCGPCQEFKCNECGKRWREAKDPAFERLKLFQSTSPKVFKAIALYVIGLPLRDVERLTKEAGCTVKRETIKTNLKRFEEKKLWGSLELHLCRLFPVVKIDDLTKLHQAVGADIQGTKSLRDYGAGLRAHYEKLCDGPERKGLDRNIDSILQLGKTKKAAKLLLLLQGRTA